MELHNAFVIPPKNILHKAHLVPCRAAVAQAHADVFPSSGPRYDDCHLPRLVSYVAEVAGHTIKPGFYDSETVVALNFRYLSHDQSFLTVPALYKLPGKSDPRPQYRWRRRG